jgi:hypothetical protein
VYKDRLHLPHIMFLTHTLQSKTRRSSTQPGPQTQNLTVSIMQPSVVLALLASIASASAAAIQAVPAWDAEDVVFYPNGLPKELVPTAAKVPITEKVARGLAKRATVSVFFCNDRNFSGFCSSVSSTDNVCSKSASSLFHSAFVPRDFLERTSGVTIGSNKLTRERSEWA